MLKLQILEMNVFTSCQKTIPLESYYTNQYFMFQVNVHCQFARILKEIALREFVPIFTYFLIGVKCLLQHSEETICFSFHQSN